MLTLNINVLLLNSSFITNTIRYKYSSNYVILKIIGIKLKSISLKNNVLTSVRLILGLFDCPVVSILLNTFINSGGRQNRPCQAGLARMRPK